MQHATGTPSISSFASVSSSLNGKMSRAQVSFYIILVFAYNIIENSSVELYRSWAAATFEPLEVWLSSQSH